MKAINIIRMYNLVNPKGKRLQLRLGVLHPEDREKFCGDTGYRWSFLGREIPMPVRNGTWFNGFPHDTMMLWLAEHEWHVETEVDMLSGKAKVYNLPEPVEEYPAETMANDEIEFNKVLQELCDKGKFGIAVQIYSYAYEVGHWTARQIVKEICNVKA